MRTAASQGSVWATMQDVAKAAGVSKMTVSRALQGSPLVTQETTARVAAVARGLGYVPNLMASSLSSGRSRIVAAVVPSLRNSQSANLLQGLGDGLAEHGCHLLVTVADNRTKGDEVIAALSGRRPDGIVLSGGFHSARTAKLLSALKIPVVETWGLTGPFIDSAVGIDARRATWDITRMLIGKGYRRIGYVDTGNGRKTFPAAKRAGFLDAMKESDLRGDLVKCVAAGSGFSGGALALAALSEQDPGLEALVCGSDVVAAGAIFECQRRGWSVPGRLAVTGFGDFELASTMVPRITTVRTHAYSLGWTAADLILSRHRPLGEPRVIDVGYELVVRESC